MNILQICKNANPVVQGVDLFEEVARCFPDHHFAFYVLRNSTMSLKQRLDCEVGSLEMSRRQVKHINIFSVTRFYRGIRHTRPDTVICHRIAPTFFTALCSLWLKPKNKIAVIHGIDQFLKPRRRLFARLFLRDWKIVAVSQAVYEDLLASGFRKSQLFLIRNAIDPEIVKANLYEREEAREKLGLAGKASPIIGTIGRLHPVKGHRYLIEAVEKADSQGSLAIIGGGDSHKALQDQIVSSGLDDKVILAGQRDNAYRYLKAFDAFIMSSLSEGLPICLLEAISAGIPCFGTHAGGIPEILTDPKWLVPSGDSDALRGLIEYIRRLSREESAEIAARQYQTMQERFGLGAYRQSYRRLVLDTGEPGPV